MLRQKRMDGVSASTSESSVAPVVVKPLIASNVESSRLPNVPSSKNGTPPSNAASTHTVVTERYTSRLEIYKRLTSRGAGDQNTRPSKCDQRRPGNRKPLQEPSP